MTENGGEGLPSIILADWGILMKMRITLEPTIQMVYFNQMLHTNTF